ncbi:DUF2891 family protein [Pseudonocardia sp. GCM10023141]|uniref:DUF2891 family protein n=1 Tax=Pseudonocardia sp. GCM10023141 TaxID=3252653 RepID=UPI0036176EBD
MHLATGDGDVRTPAELYPAFHTSYDWHSCVHMHWLGVEILRSGLDAADLHAALAATLTANKLAAEADYLRARRSFERPYGWAWAARLAASCRDTEWADAFGPLTDAVYDKAVAWASMINHPVRHGVHSNTAFGLALLVTAAADLGRPTGAAALRDAAVRLFGGDRDWAQQWELSGQDFLSAGLAEADLMARVLDPAAFRTWFAAFLPEPDAILRPAVVTDPTDPQMVHLDGLNLSRAGALYRLSRVLDAPVLRSAADVLLDHGLRATGGEEYVATHWLASFAWDALLSK